MQHYKRLSSTAPQTHSPDPEPPHAELSDALTALGFWLTAVLWKVQSTRGQKQTELAELLAKSRIQHRRACTAVHRLQSSESFQGADRIRNLPTVRPSLPGSGKKQHSSHSSRVVEIDGSFVGVAFAKNGLITFVALDARLDALDGGTWPTFSELRHAILGEMACDRPQTANPNP